MSIIKERRSSTLPTGDLLTARAVNRRADELRNAFAAIGVKHPTPYIVWDNALSDAQKERLQQLLCGVVASRTPTCCP
jgi:hypothetical protein